MGTRGAPNRRSIRLRGYDYTNPGAYFITLVTQRRRLLFGEVDHEGVRLTPSGQMIAAAWEALPARFPTIELGRYVIMPNHFHGIVVIRGAVGATFMVARDRAGMNPAPTDTTREAPPTLGRVVGAFKSLTARAYVNGARTAGWPSFNGRLWQRNYYERILRDEAEWKRIDLYIESNPVQWETDTENPLSRA